MPLNAKQALEAAMELREKGDGERAALDEVRRYWTGRQPLSYIVPRGAPREVVEMARMSRVNITGLVVESLSQSLFVEGFRGKSEASDSAVWEIWQANKLDARQSGIHRAALAYGTSYAIVLPGDPVPVIRGVSPRLLTALYSEDDSDWPVRALEWRRDGTFRMYDAEAVYELAGENGIASGPLELVDILEYDGVQPEVCPVVRFVEVEDLDIGTDVTDESIRGISRGARRSGRLASGQVTPIMALQDQIDQITFNLLVAQHYGAFRQRYVIGWLAPDERTKAEAAASRLWTFDDPTIQVGDLPQTELEGSIKAREASLRHAASLSQTPSHELIGELVNLSAEALAAAEAGRDRKVADRQTLFGESHEQMLRLAGKLAGKEPPDDAQARWRETSARAIGAVVDALVKLSKGLGIPEQELWNRVPGATQLDVERWKKAAAEEPPPVEPALMPEDMPADNGLPPSGI